MADPQNYAVTSLADKDAITLTIDGVDYEVVQFAANFAVNEIPTAQCMLAVGRDVRNPGELAKINKTAAGLRAMKRASVTLFPDGEYKPNGERWPADRFLAFDGYYSGFSYVKSNGKVFVVVHLIHWLADLGFTSTLNAVTHAPSPAALAFPNVFETLEGTLGGTAEGAWLSSSFGYLAVVSALPTDLWVALKSLFCGMAFYEGFNPATPVPGVSTEELKKNMRARKALQAIEGPGGRCDFAYRYGVPLKLTVPAQQAFQGIAEAICHVATSDMVQHTLWDAMIGYYCPMFGLDLWPQIERAVVAASLPGYRTKQWRSILPDEYEYVDQTAELPKPLRGVVVHGDMTMPGGTNSSDKARSGIPYMAGSYAPPREDQPGDGAVMYQQMPAWLSQIANFNNNAGTTTGQKDNKAVGNGEGNNPPDLTPGQMIKTASDMANKFAQSLYVQNNLRGRSGTFSGKLRFDIGPGSHIKLVGSPEKFMGAEDKLAADMYGQVNRVTVEANAESRRAATAFGITHMRNEAENEDERTSIAAHPFYGDSIAVGAPLHDLFREK